MPFNDKYLRSLPTFELAGHHIKPYHVTVEPDGVIAADIVSAAYEFTAGNLLCSPDEEMPPAAWVVVHQGRGGPMFVCVYDWVWGNAIQARTAAAAEPFLGCADDDPTHFTGPLQHFAGCVWELAMLEHERAAWVRHLLVPGQPDLESYLADRMPDGPVGLGAAGQPAPRSGARA